MAEELWRKGAVQLAALIRDGEVTSREVVTAHLDRISEVNERVNAVVEVMADRALADADAADRRRAAGEPLGPFHGVPYTIKANLDYEGSATTEGVVALKDLIAPSDAPVVARMRAAGAIGIGRTNLPDFGLRVNTESELYGATHNPWDHERTAGGSSGGEAAAIATGMSPIGLGNDIGGSLRNPAYCCGIASIKPSFGRVAHANDSQPIDPMLNSQLMMVDGVLARHVADVRHGLRVVMGSDPRDPHAIDAPLEGPPRPKRVALVPEPPGGATDPDVADGVRAAGRALAARGYEVDEVTPAGVVDAYLAWTELMASGISELRPLMDAVMGADGKRFLSLATAAFPEATVASLSAMHQTRYRVHRGFQQFFADYPLIVGPVWTQKPFKLGYDIESPEAALSVVELFRFVLPANLMGLPSACVATGLRGGLPTGVQIMGARWREDLCLDAAEAIEGELGALTPIDPR